MLDCVAGLSYSQPTARHTRSSGFGRRRNAGAGDVIGLELLDASLFKIAGDRCPFARVLCYSPHLKLIAWFDGVGAAAKQP